MPASGQEGGLQRATLDRSLGRLGLFALAFGSMIGVGWVTGLGGWLQQAGPVGAALAFAAGGGLMLAIGLCYAEVTPMLPLAGGEVAYAYKAYGTGKAFLVGWFLAFGYVSVSAFEAISVGRVVSYLFPGFDRWLLYSVDGSPVYASHLLLAVVCTALITALNYYGVKWAAKFQTWLTLGFLAVALAFLSAGFAAGKFANLSPAFPAGSLVGLGGFLAVFVTVPFWFVGFDTIPQGAEEVADGVPPRQLAFLILGSIAAAAAFYALLVISVSMVGPWQRIAQSDLPTARAFELAFDSALWSRLVLAAALIGLLTSWNGFFLAGSRVLFALGRGRIIPAAFGESHPRYATPHVAVLFTGAATVVAPLLGRDALLAVVNVGSFCIAVAFLGVALSVRRLRRDYPALARPYRMPAIGPLSAIAALGSAGMLAAMLIPGSPAALAWPLEGAILVGLAALGGAMWLLARPLRGRLKESDRALLILERYASAEPASEATQ